MSAAFAEYRRLAGADSSADVLAGSYEWHAIRRLGELQRAGETPALSETRPIVLSIGRGVWSRLTDLAGWVEQIQKAGVTAMLVEAGTSGVDRNQVGRAGVYFRTTTVPVVDDFFGRLIPLAHAKGLAVIAVLDLHQATWMAPKPDWVVRQPESNAESSSRSLGVVNVLHPDYQQTVSRIVDDLGRTEVDGLMLQARRPTGFAGELDAPAKNTFETMVVQPIDADPKSPVFWKWAGWKSRSYLRFAEQLREQFRRERRTRLVAIAVHSSAVLDPKAALIQFGEDLFETKLRGFDVVVLPGAETIRVDPTSMDVSQRSLPKAGGTYFWPATSFNMTDPANVPTSLQSVLATLSVQGPIVLMDEGALP
jgi:hypothetical protein